MTKEELIYITLRQLSDNLKASPENFRLEGDEIGPYTGNFPGPTIVWQFKFKLKENEYIQDPLNAARTIMVSYNKMSNKLICAIYFREVNSPISPVSPDSQVEIHYSIIPSFHRTYRQFNKIRNKLIKQHREKEYIEYLKKLNNIFPSTHDDDLFR